MDGVRDLLTDICLVGTAATFAACLALCARRRFRLVADSLSRLPRSSVAAFLLFAAVATVCAQKQGGTNSPPNGASPPQMAGMPTPGLVPPILPGAVGTVSVSSNDVARGFWLESISTNGSYSYAMPTSGTRYAKWWLRGAYEDVFRLDLDGMLFPLGTNLCSSLWVYTWGMAGARLGDASNRVAATGVPMSAAPGISRFWDATTTNGSHLLTWENFFLGRDTNTPVSAQLELMPTGDFVARSNLVESVYRRINPDDADDDGIPDDEDHNPYAYDGDNFGPRQTLPEGANSNAYCWVDVVVSNASAMVTFTGDGPSALPDPRFIARAGEAHRVILLIGKAYTATCDMPIAVVGKSDPEIEVTRTSANRIGIVWPVEIWSEDYGSYFEMFVSPDFLGGAFSWNTNGCCEISGSGSFFTFFCDGGCGCGGCSIDGHYRYESYDISVFSGECGCVLHSDDEDEPDEPGATVSFSTDAVIFESRHEESPGVWAPRRSTRTGLSCSAFGGPNGGMVVFSIVGEGRLVKLCGRNFPVMRNLAPNETVAFSVLYEGLQASSSVGDIVASASFIENTTNAVAQTSQATLTSVEIEIMRQAEAPENNCTYRHKFGVNEVINCNNWPAAANVSWTSTTLNNVSVSSGTGTYRCPLYAAENPLSVSYGGASYTPAISVVEPNGIQVRNPEVRTYITSPGRAGWVGLRQEFYVKPFDVSFSEISIEEVPCTTGTHSGYFSDPSFSVIWCHSVANGAGEWCSIEEHTNKMGINDTARITMELLRIDGDGNFTDNPAYSWANGEITWDIPFGWGAKPQGTGASAVLYKQFDPDAGHRITIVPSGTVSVRKFGNEATRDIQGNTYLNGVLCQ